MKNNNSFNQNCQNNFNGQGNFSPNQGGFQNGNFPPPNQGGYQNNLQNQNMPPMGQPNGQPPMGPNGQPPMGPNGQPPMGQRPPMGPNGQPPMGQRPPMGQPPMGNPQNNFGPSNPNQEEVYLSQKISVTDELMKWIDLRDKEIITQEEYETKKKELLSISLPKVYFPQANGQNPQMNMQNVNFMPQGNRPQGPMGQPPIGPYGQPPMGQRPPMGPNGQPPMGPYGQPPMGQRPPMGPNGQPPMGQPNGQQFNSNNKN